VYFGTQSGSGRCWVRHPVYRQVRTSVWTTAPYGAVLCRTGNPLTSTVLLAFPGLNQGITRKHPRIFRHVHRRSHPKGCDGV